MAAKPVHRGFFQQETAGEGLDRFAVLGEIDRGIEQQLKTGRGLVVAGGLCDHGREIAAGAVAADGETTAIDTEFVGPGDDIAECGNGVMGAGRCRMLRREAIIDRDDHTVGAFGQRAAHAVVRIQRTDHEAAAVIEHQCAALVRALGRAVDARGDRPVGPGQLCLARIDVTLRRRLEQLTLTFHEGAFTRDRAAAERGAAAEVLQAKQHLCLHIQRLTVADDGTAGQNAQ